MGGIIVGVTLIGMLYLLNRQANTIEALEKIEERHLDYIQHLQEYYERQLDLCYHYRHK